MIAPHITLFGVGPGGRGSQCGRAPAAENSSFSFIRVRVCVCACVGTGLGVCLYLLDRELVRQLGRTPPGCRARSGNFFFFLEYSTPGFKGPPSYAHPGPAGHLFDRIRWVFLSVIAAMLGVVDRNVRLTPIEHRDGWYPISCPQANFILLSFS